MDPGKKIDLFISVEEILAPILVVVLAALFGLAFFHFNQREEAAFFRDGIRDYRPCQTCARRTRARQEALGHLQPTGT
jgi:hypothetical protein